MLDQFLKSLIPPPWLQAEILNKLGLLANHILQQEPAAQVRLIPHSGRRIHFVWLQLAADIVITPAGLLNISPANVQPEQHDSSVRPSDLSIRIDEPSVRTVLWTLAKGEKPSIHIAGDVQLAAEINWLIHHVRWDFEEDASRILGDAPARQLGIVLREVAQTIKAFLSARIVKHSNHHETGSSDPSISSPPTSPVASFQSP